MGLQPASRLRSLREAAVAIRRLLDGEELTEDGETFSFERVRLRHPPSERVPLYFGVHGPRSLELGGEIADGTLLGWFSSADYVRWARGRIDEGRARAGRTDDHSLVALCILALSDDDPTTARRRLSVWASGQLIAMAGTPGMTATESGRELATAVDHRDPEEETELPDRLMDRFVAAGDTAACAAMLEGLLDAGAERIVLVPNPAGIVSTREMVGQIRAAARTLRLL